MNTQQIIETAEEKLIHTYNRYQIVLDKGDGVRLYDTDGKEYLDFGAGIAVFALGYNNKEYNDAVALFGTDLDSKGMNTIVGYVYSMLYNETGGYPSYASAAAIILFLIVLTITCINLMVNRKHA